MTAARDFTGGGRRRPSLGGVLEIPPLAPALLLAGAAVPASAAADRHRSLPAPGPNQFDLEAHRGGIGLTTENTLEAFDNALKLGVTTLELDVQITEDRVAVVTHDRRIAAQKCRDTRPVVAGDSQYPYVGKYIKDLTLAQVRTLDCSLPWPTFGARSACRAYRCRSCGRCSRSCPATAMSGRG